MYALVQQSLMLQGTVGFQNCQCMTWTLSTDLEEPTLTLICGQEMKKCNYAKERLSGKEFLILVLSLYASQSVSLAPL